LEYKAAGNGFFKAGDLMNAKKEYNQCVEYLSDENGQEANAT